MELHSPGHSVERMTGIEPALSAWEAGVLPLNYIRKDAKPSALGLGPQQRRLRLTVV